MFAFSQVEPETSGRVTNFPTPIDSYLNASFKQGWHDSAFNSVMRMTEYGLDAGDEKSPMMDADEANQRFSIAGHLKFDEPVRESVAQLMNDRKRAEMDRNFLLENGSSMLRFAPGMAASMLGGLSNPLDFALMFFPITGSTKLARAASIAGKGRLTSAFLHGMVPVESIAKAGIPYPKFSASVLQGVVGQGVFEIPNALASLQDKAEYSRSQFMANVLMSGAFAGAIHAAAHAYGRLRVDTKTAILKEKINEFLTGKEADVESFIKVDENVIRDKVKAEMDAMRAQAEAEVDPKSATKFWYHGSPSKFEKFDAAKLGETTGKADAKEGFFFSDNPKLIQVFYDNAQRMDWNDLVVRELEEEGHTAAEIEQMKPNPSIYRIKNLAQKIKHIDVSNIDSKADFSGYAELLKAAKAEGYEGAILEGVPLLHNGPSRMLAIFDPKHIEIDKSAHGYNMTHEHEIFQVDQQVAAERQRQVEEVFQKKLKDFDPKQRFNELARQEMEAQIKAGKTLPAVDVEHFTYPEDFGKVKTALEKEIGELQNDMKLAEGDQGKPDQKTVYQAAISKLDEHIKNLEIDRSKMSINPVLDALGKPLLRGMLIIIREALKSAESFDKAIDAGIDWLKLHENKKIPPDPAWQVIVQEGQVPGDKGYIQIDDVSGGKNKWSSNPEKLKEQGYDMPDLSKLKTGKYKMGDVLPKQKEGMSRRSFLDRMIKAAAAAGVAPHIPMKELLKTQATPKLPGDVMHFITSGVWADEGGFGAISSHTKIVDFLKGKLTINDIKSDPDIRGVGLQRGEAALVGESAASNMASSMWAAAGEGPESRQILRDYLIKIGMPEKEVGALSEKALGRIIRNLSSAEQWHELLIRHNPEQFEGKLVSVEVPHDLKKIDIFNHPELTKYDDVDFGPGDTRPPEADLTEAWKIVTAEREKADAEIQPQGDLAINARALHKLKFLKEQDILPYVYEQMHPISDMMESIVESLPKKSALRELLKNKARELEVKEEAIKAKAEKVQPDELAKPTTQDRYTQIKEAIKQEVESNQPDPNAQQYALGTVTSEGDVKSVKLLPDEENADVFEHAYHFQYGPFDNRWKFAKNSSEHGPNKVTWIEPPDEHQMFAVEEALRRKYGYEVKGHEDYAGRQKWPVQEKVEINPLKAIDTAIGCILETL